MPSKIRFLIIAVALLILLFMLFPAAKPVSMESALPIEGSNPGLQNPNALAKSDDDVDGVPSGAEVTGTPPATESTTPPPEEVE